jgi:polysaccharide export outer membrane protein
MCASRIKPLPKFSKPYEPYFVVGGEVTRPGKFDMRGDTTVMQAITIAGGFNDKSKATEVLLFRRVSDDWVEVKKVNLKEMLSRQNLTEDLHLNPGDMILVPKTTFSKIARFLPVPTVSTYFSPHN